MLCGLTPGPHELDADALQYFMKFFVDDLLMLYDDGIVVKTPAFPEGTQYFVQSVRRTKLTYNHTAQAASCDLSSLSLLEIDSHHDTSKYRYVYAESHAPLIILFFGLASLDCSAHSAVATLATYTPAWHERTHVSEW